MRVPPMLNTMLVSGATVVTTYSAGASLAGAAACWVAAAGAAAGLPEGVQGCKAGLVDWAELTVGKEDRTTATTVRTMSTTRFIHCSNSSCKKLHLKHFAF